MNEEVNSLNELDSNSSPEQSIQPTEPKIDNLGRSYATGRRKDSTKIIIGILVILEVLNLQHQKKY